MKLMQVEALKSYFELYPYLDLAKGSAEPLYPSNVDLFVEFNKIAADPTITTEFDFQSRLSETVTSLHDAHASYQPTCFVAARFLQPWVIAARYPEGLSVPEIYLRDTVTAGSFVFSEYSRRVQPFLTPFVTEFEGFWGRTLGRDPAGLVGYVVEEIDGVDVLTYIQNYADRIGGTSRVPDARFNNVLPTTTYINGTMRMIDALLYRITYAPSSLPTSRTYKLRGPSGDSVEITAPWGGYLRPPAAFTDQASFYRSYCTRRLFASSPGGVSQRSVPLSPRDTEEGLRDGVETLRGVSDVPTNHVGGRTLINPD
ncbi:hypothetical protein HDU67_005411, partial [Dinochytrium kinnereticum]